MLYNWPDFMGICTSCNTCSLDPLDSASQTTLVQPFLHSTVYSVWQNTINAQLQIFIVPLTHHHTTTILWPFFRDHLAEPVPEENFWTLWCKGRLTEADTPTIQLGATPSGLTSAHVHHPQIFCKPDALPAAQPTASKHQRQLAHSD